MSTSSLRGLLGHRAAHGTGAVAVHSAAVKGMATLAVTAVAGLAVTGTGVYALMRAQAYNSTQTVSAGTLVLTLAGTGSSGGLTSAVANMAPGDTVNRFVEVKNTGTVPGTNLTLQLSDQATANALTTDAVNGLQVTVTSCSQAWTLVAGVGACGGTTTTALTTTSAVAVKAAPLVLNAGAVAPNGSGYYRVGVSLPAGNEVTVNGTPPLGTVQGLGAALRWTFTLDQRAATSTDT